MRQTIPHRRQQGAVAVIFAIVITAMIGMAGLALDLGQLYVAKTELQNAADACALSAAQSLSGSDGKQLQISQAAGLTTAQRHRVLFQSRTVATQSDGSIEFAAGLGGPWYHSSDLAVSNATTLTMRYARCALVQNNIPTWLIQTLNVLPGVNIGMQSMSASAVARLQPSQTTCAIPVAICKDQLVPKGNWFTGPEDQNSNTDSRWADLGPQQGGAAELADILTGTGQCQLPSAELSIAGRQPGNIASLAKAYNSRFGIYEGNVRSTEAQPDRTGYAYTDNSPGFGGNWNKSAGNAYADFVSKRTSNTPYQGGNSDVRGSVLSATDLAAKGGDRRIAIAPVVDCPLPKSSQTVPVQQWACVLLLHPMVGNLGAKRNSQLVADGSNAAIGNGNGKGKGNTGGNSGETLVTYLEYLGSASEAGSPCASVGLPGGGGSNGPLVSALVR